MKTNGKRILLLVAAALLLCAAVLGMAAWADRARGEADASGTPAEPEYARLLFDTSLVHTLDIRVPEGSWESFIAACTDKEYLPCDLLIDGEEYPQAAIRAKGNSSMQMARNTQKYSFKIEFDHYRDETWHGLDKLNLNNLVMDSSCSKDYLVYRMMDEFGVDAPLCSFVFVTVNGADWGLYAAVEGVEDSFLERNYGPDHGELYKPDNISNHKGDEDGGGFGGGPGFNPAALLRASAEASAARETAEQTAAPAATEPAIEERASEETASAEPETEESAPAERPSFEPPAGGGFGGMGADDVKLRYIDGDPESYPNIFDSAKTDVGRRDKYRLIEALRRLGEREDLERTLDTEEVLRYFTAHLFTCNSDSYTGGMVHNYYLYEEDGRLSMIPWDYNLAFGQQSGASQVVNDPIDTPADGRLESLPMLAWIFDDGPYFARYHELYREFLARFCESGWIDGTIEECRTLLAPYVARDPHSFCTPEEFERGLDQLALFCSLRARSIAGQLDGSIPATTEGQRADGSALIDASGLNASGEFGGRGGPSLGPSGEASGSEE